MIDLEEKWNRKTSPALIGFLLSIAITLAAYYFSIEKTFSGNQLLIGLMGLAAIQALVQLVFFLHLGIEPEPEWGLFLFGLMLFIIIFVVSGSIWIMQNLNYNLMPQMEMHP